MYNFLVVHYIVLETEVCIVTQSNVVSYSS